MEPNGAMMEPKMERLKKKMEQKNKKRERETSKGIEKGKRIELTFVIILVFKCQINDVPEMILKRRPVWQ